MIGVKMNNTVGMKIRQIRAIKKITQEKLGKAIGLPKQAISLIEKGKRKISISEIAKISKFLETDFDFFLDSIEFKKNPEDSKIIYEIVNKKSGKIVDSFSFSDYKYGFTYSEVWNKLLERIGRPDIYIRLNYNESQVMKRLESEVLARELEALGKKTRNKKNTKKRN